MLDVGFFEIVLVCVVALLVLGPDKLPGTIRTVGLWVGRLKRSFNNIRTEIEKEVGADEIRRQLRNEEIMEKIKSTQKQFTSTVDSVKKEAAAVTDSLKPEGMNELKKDFDSVTGKSSPKTEDTSQKTESSGPGEKVTEKKETTAPAPEASRPASSEPPSEKPDSKADSQG